MELPHSPACDRNQEPILSVLKEYIPDETKTFLEIGFGTAQHAFAFSQNLKDLTYYAADQSQYHPIFEQRKKVLGIPENLKGPYLFHANDGENKVEEDFPEKQFDVVFSANTLHIMSWEEAALALEKMTEVISPDGMLFLYGPFSFKGEFTSESNLHFHHSLQSKDPRMGIRPFEDVAGILVRGGLNEKKILTMPANNNMLVFQKT